MGRFVHVRASSEVQTWWPIATSRPSQAVTLRRGSSMSIWFHACPSTDVHTAPHSLPSSHRAAPTATKSDPNRAMLDRWVVWSPKPSTLVQVNPSGEVHSAACHSLSLIPSVPTATRVCPSVATSHMNTVCPVPSSAGVCGTRLQVRPFGEVHTAAAPLVPRVPPAMVSCPTATHPGPPAVMPSSCPDAAAGATLGGRSMSQCNPSVEVQMPGRSPVPSLTAIRPSAPTARSRSARSRPSPWLVASR